MKHLVNQLRIEIHCPSEEQALQLRHNFSLALQQQIEVVIDRVCSRYIAEDEWIHLNRLELDLGTFSTYTFYQTFADVFSGKFEEALLQKIASIPPEERRESIQRSQVELLQYFLLAGTTPWWADEKELDIDAIVSEQMQKHKKGFVNFLQRNRFNENLWRRIVLQLNPDTRYKIVAALPALLPIVQVYKTWTDMILEQHNSLASSVERTDILLADIVLEHVPALSEADNANQVQTIFEKSVPRIFSGASQQELQNAVTALPTAIGQNTTPFGAIVNTEASAMPADTTPVAERYISKYAGAVLLAQFLRPFFQKIDLLDGVSWKSKAAQYKGVQLVRFLCTGEQYTPEYSLVLEKLLCGVPIEEPVPLDAALQQKELDEAIVLLNAIIEHWQALRNTSVDGLRNSFLVRDGSLSRNDGHWLLQVERKTMDVLLEKLPWGYTTITLPWNNYLIYVEW
jgi:hypothetical protein